MNLIGKVINAFLQGPVRKVKIAIYGPDDVHFAPQAAPFGLDSSPIPGLIAIYAQTATKGAPAIVGYYFDPAKPLPISPTAMPGETILYSSDADGNLVTFIRLKNVAGAGQIVMGGSADNLVRYTPLNAGLQSEVAAINAQLTLIQTAIASLGGTYARVDVTLDISAAKINEIKTL